MEDGKQKAICLRQISCRLNTAFLKRYYRNNRNKINNIENIFLLEGSSGFALSASQRQGKETFTLRPLRLCGESC
jgi:hypothetical protein